MNLITYPDTVIVKGEQNMPGKHQTISVASASPVC